jgi:hypothetical protein
MVEAWLGKTSSEKAQHAQHECVEFGLIAGQGPSHRWKE